MRALILLVLLQYVFCSNHQSIFQTNFSRSVPQPSVWPVYSVKLCCLKGYKKEYLSHHTFASFFQRVESILQITKHLAKLRVKLSKMLFKVTYLRSPIADCSLEYKLLCVPAACCATDEAFC
jgi:hypothetical protein